MFPSDMDHRAASLISRVTFSGPRVVALLLIASAAQAGQTLYSITTDYKLLLYENVTFHGSLR